MKKFTHKLIAILLCLVMIGGMLPMGVQAEGTEVAATEYTLYPIPQSIAYGDGSFELNDINAIYGEGVDEYTKDRLEEAAALRELSVTEAAAADSTKTNVYVAINGSGDAVESYIKANYTVDTTLFEKIDANFVAFNNGEIVVLGKDTDSCFYGLTTLYQILGQLTDNALRNLTINDYADVASRGFIEGYYGNPWSVEDRAALMTWGGYYKLNSYFYAPKDDPKHNSAWRELYTDEEIKNDIEPLAKAGNASKCRFIYALHPYMNNRIDYTNDDTYQADLDVLKAKFRQVIDAGVRQIAIMSDDVEIGTIGQANYIKTLTDVSNWVKELQTTYPDLKLTMPCVAPGFEYAGYGQSYYRNLPENVQIMMTGGQVWGFVSPSFVNTFYNNVGRGAYMWINWPCTDNSKNHLIMGGYSDFLQVGVDPSKLSGIVLNPMQQSEPSKVAIFGNACYSWNMWESKEEADAAWEASFACVDHNTVVPNATSEALKELSKHMIDQTRFEDNPNVLEESVVLRHQLSSFLEKLNAGTITVEDIDSMIEEFTILQNAAKLYREKGNEAIVTQIEPWLGNWDDTTLSIISYLNALKAILNEDGDAAIWEHYANGQAAYESSKNHPLWYVNHWEYAEAGYRFIVPFMKALDTYLSDIAMDIVYPAGRPSSGASGTPLTLTAFDGNKPGYYEGTVGNVVDGNTSTYVWYNQVAQPDQFIGVNLGRAVKLGAVTFTQDSGDRFASYELQYSTDGTNYTTYGTYTDAVLEVNLASDGIVAQYVRFVSSNSNGKWVKIYEINVTEAPSTSVMTNRAELESWASSIVADRAEVVNTGSLTLAPNEYLGLDLGRIKDLTNVTATEKGALTLEVSKNGHDWVEIESGNTTEDARYVRLINKTDADITVNLTELSATSNEVSGPTLHSTNIGVNSSWGVGEDSRDNGAAFDGDVSTTTEFGDFVTAGQYIIYDLGQTRQIKKLEIYCAGSAVNYIRDAEMQISNDLENWTTVLTIGDGQQNTGEDNVTCIESDAGYRPNTDYPNYVSIEGELDEAQDARYIQIYMTANNNERAVLFNEIEINEGEYVSVSNDPTFEVSAIEVQGYPPQNMTDGDLTTSWKPNTNEAGSMVYTFSENLTLNRINIVQKSVSNAKVSLLADNDGERTWIEMGTLDKSLVTLECDNDLNLALKIEWAADAVPNITEIVRYCEHEIDEYVSNNNATCSADGTKTGICVRCGYEQTIADEGSKLPHTEVDMPDVEATWDAPGMINAKQCSVCGEITTKEIVPALYNQGIIPLEALDVTAGDEEKNGGASEGPAGLVMDDNFGTIWHTDWYGTSRDNHWIQFEITGEYTVKGLRYLPRQVGGTNGTITQYAIQVSDDGESFNTVNSGTWAEDSTWKIVEFDGIQAKYVRLVAVNATTDSTYVFASAAEIRLIGDKVNEQPVQNPFEDVPEGEFYYEPVLWAVAEGITTGATETTYDPEGDLLRAQFVTMLWRNAGSPKAENAENPFTDVTEEDFFYDAVLWAVEKGITNGISKTEFGAYQVTNRAQAVTFLWRYMNQPASTEANDFTDVEAGEWYEAPINWAVEKGVTKGMGDGTFGVENPCNRAHAVTFMYRALAD